MATVRDLIKDSMRLAGIIASGETPSADEESDVFRSLNRMISTWSVEGFLIYRAYREEFTLVPGQAAYTFGLTGNFNSARPFTIQEVTLKDGTSEYPLESLNVQQWAYQQQKSQQSTVPSRYYLEGTFPLETINLWPVPSEAKTLVVYSLKPLTQFASVNETISLPEGYEDSILHNLTVRIGPEFGKMIEATVFDIADKTKANLKRKNIKPVYAKSDAFGLTKPCGYNIWKGE